MADLAYTVYLADPTNNGQIAAFGPGDKVPSWAKKEIGPHAYEGYNPETGEIDDDSDSGDVDGPPPQSGRGSGDKAWQAYAAQDEVAAQLEAAGETVEPDAKKEDIIAALERAGVPTE